MAVMKKSPYITDPWEILKKLPPVSVEANAAKQLLDRLKYYDCELPKDSSYVEMDWIRRKCQEWLSKRQSIPGAVEELVEAFLCTKGLGYLVSYMYPTGTLQYITKGVWSRGSIRPWYYHNIAGKLGRIYIWQIDYL